MILVISYSHKDVRQALRQMKWIGFLSEKRGHAMLQESILLVPSIRASRYDAHKEICWLATHCFGEARCFIPETEHEVGWPGSANWMFGRALEHVEKHLQDDMFFLEPDGIPLVPHWWATLKDDWNSAKGMGKHFMGAYVPHSVPHMTGIAVYGKDWRMFAPNLAACPDHDAFDTFSGHQILPYAFLQPTIQHVFRRHEPGWSVPSLGILDPRAVLFHQDKQGKLIPMIDQHAHNGECYGHPMFGYDHLYKQQLGMTKFYYTANATRVHNIGQRTFGFSPLEPFGGAIPGVLTTDNEDDQAALQDLTSNPTTGVREITQAEWEEVTKKKWLTNSSTSEVSNLSQPQMPAASILTVPHSQSPARLVAEPSKHNIESLGTTTIQNIEDVIKTEPVTPAQAAQVPPSKRPRKEQKT